MKQMYPEQDLNVRKNLVLYTPCIICYILIAFSPLTGWIYQITEYNVYKRGTYLFPISFLSYGYWIVSACLVVREIIMKKRIRESSLYVTLLVFPIPTVIGMFLQFKMYGLSVIWICSAVSLLILFINIQNYQLSRDILTGVFNRGQTNKYIQWEVEHLSNTNNMLFAIMIDVDHFKKINDEFGHLVGDQAIITVSRMLQSACKKYFVGRFGGDEFLVIGHVRSQEEIDVLIKNIKIETERCNSQGQYPYQITLSMGYSMFRKEDDPTIDRVISEADQAMYKAKVDRDNGRNKNHTKQ